ncbi:hypothetical protein CFP56_033900 [Quercus suber]|uniref:Uncharacterized protein n=1 Tax=Quercus suber TaxID=58331 RepID=A0AAW0JEA0_QUESU
MGTVSKKRHEGAVEVHKTGTSAVISLKDGSDGCSVDHPESVERLKDGIKGKIASCIRESRGGEFEEKENEGQNWVLELKGYD